VKNGFQQGGIGDLEKPRRGRGIVYKPPGQRGFFVRRKTQKKGERRDIPGEIRLSKKNQKKRVEKGPKEECLNGLLPLTDPIV